MAENLGDVVLKLSTDSKKFDKGIGKAEKSAGGLLSKRFGGLDGSAPPRIAAGLRGVIGKTSHRQRGQNSPSSPSKVGVSVKRLSGLAHAANIVRHRAWAR